MYQYLFLRAPGVNEVDQSLTFTKRISAQQDIAFNIVQLFDLGYRIRVLSGRIGKGGSVINTSAFTHSMGSQVASGCIL